MNTLVFIAWVAPVLVLGIAAILFGPRIGAWWEQRRERRDEARLEVEVAGLTGDRRGLYEKLMRVRFMTLRLDKGQAMSIIRAVTLRIDVEEVWGAIAKLPCEVEVLKNDVGLAVVRHLAGRSFFSQARELAGHLEDRTRCGAFLAIFDLALDKSYQDPQDLVEARLGADACGPVERAKGYLAIFKASHLDEDLVKARQAGQELAAQCQRLPEERRDYEPLSGVLHAIAETSGETEDRNASIHYNQLALQAARRELLPDMPPPRPS